MSQTKIIEKIMPALREIASEVDMGKVKLNTRLELMELCISIYSECHIKTCMQEGFPRIEIQSLEEIQRLEEEHNNKAH